LTHHQLVNDSALSENKKYEVSMIYKNLNCKAPSLFFLISRFSNLFTNTFKLSQIGTPRALLFIGAA